MDVVGCIYSKVFVIGEKLRVKELWGCMVES